MLKKSSQVIPGNAEATYADPVILRDGDLGRLAIVHATTKYEGLLNGEVATQMIVNYLLAAPTMMETVETPPEPTPPEVVNIDLTDPNALPNRLTIEGGTLVSARLPETSTAATAPRLQADITEVNASPGGTIFLPFEYSGTNALAGCIVCIEGVPGYYDLPYTGAADALPTAIPVGLSINLELGTFEVCYSVYDDQGQYGNFLTAVINVEEITDVMPGDGLVSDEFDGIDLQSFWNVQNGDRNPYMLSDGKLVVEGGQDLSNIFLDDDSTRFYQVTDQDQFTVETSLVFDYGSTCAVAGLIISSPTTDGYQGDWVLLKIWGIRSSIVLQFQNRASEIVARVPDYNATPGKVPITMRLEKDGDTYTAWYKPDAEGAWIEIGQTTIALPAPWQVGVYTGLCEEYSGAGVPTGPLTVSFDYFRSTTPE